MIRIVLATTMAIAFFVTSAASSAIALEDWERAIGSRATSVRVCAAVDGVNNPERCDPAPFAALSQALDREFALTLARAKPATKPLIMRDQVWAKDLIESFDDILDAAGADTDVAARSIDMFNKRASDLKAVRANLGRHGLVGRWINAFGSIDVQPAQGGGHRITVRTASAYGRSETHTHVCAASALAIFGEDGWLAGDVVVEAGSGERAGSANSPPRIKITRQGETLRVVALGGDEDAGSLASDFGCSHQNQITGTYFPAGPDAGGGETHGESDFVAPTFDCLAPETPTDEEICADPELARGDQALNRAWKSLLSKLKGETREQVIADQRSYIRAQAHQYEKFLHPVWDKASEGEHFTRDGYASLRRLQRERIAFLEGFDVHRKGLLGLWLASDAILEVTEAEHDMLHGFGAKWDASDYRRTCDFELIIHGDGRPAMVRADGGGVSAGPPAGVRVKRDAMSLVVTVISKATADDRLCTRGLDPEARLFPVKSSPDITSKFLSIR